MSAALPLATSVAIYGRARQSLITEHGLADDDPVLLDTLDGMSDLPDQLAAMLRRAREKEAQAKALAEIIAEMKDRKSRLETSAEGLRRAAAWAAVDAEIPRLERPDFTASFGLSAPALKGEVDPAMLPDRFVRIKREADKRAIRAAMDAGEDVPGFALSNGRPQVTLRVR